MSNYTPVQFEETSSGSSAAAAFLLCSVSGVVVGFVMGLVAAWL